MFMNEVIKIFMNRDKMSYYEAYNQFKEIRKEIYKLEDSFEAEEILMEYSLEMDYLFDFI